MIFGGEAFVDLIGEISLMKDLTKSMDITMEQEQEMQDAELAEAAAAGLNVGDEKQASEGKEASAAFPSSPPPYVSGDEKVPVTEKVSQPSSSSPPPYPPGDIKTGYPDEKTPQSTSGASTPRRNFHQQAITDRSDEEARMEAEGLSPEEKELRRKEKKKGLSKEQRERLAAFEMQRKKEREERVNTLSQKLINRLSILTETDKSPEVIEAFKEKTRLEVENLKMESFGLEILHAIGTTYVQKASSLLKSQKFLGISGFFSRLKDKGTLAKETWTTISTAIDAQMTMEEMAKLEEKGGEDWTDEKKAEYEKRVTGKILAAAWRGSKFEIQSVLREVCDQVLNDRSVRLEKRIERAEALVICGKIFQDVCPFKLSSCFFIIIILTCHQAQRDPDEEGDYMAFEKLMAEGMAKKDKNQKKKEGKRPKSESYSTDPTAAAAPSEEKQ